MLSLSGLEAASEAEESRSWHVDIKIPVSLPYQIRAAHLYNSRPDFIPSIVCDYRSKGQLLS